MELPPANWADPRLKECDECDEMFMGSCEYKYGVAATDEEGQEIQPEEPQEDGEQKGIQEKKRPLYELERLAITVRSILFDCNIVPKGV